VKLNVNKFTVFVVFLSDARLNVAQLIVARLSVAPVNCRPVNYVRFVTPDEVSHNPVDMRFLVILLLPIPSTVQQKITRKKIPNTISRLKMKEKTDKEK